MREFLVESYVPRSTPDGLRSELDRARRAVDAVRLEGREIELLRTIFVPADETCFFVYRAATSDDVREAAGRAGLPTANVVEAVTRAANGTRRRVRTP